jgi:hypothetical protein
MSFAYLKGFAAATFALVANVAAGATVLSITGQFIGTPSSGGPIYGGTYTSTLNFDETMHGTPYSIGGAGTSVSYGDGSNPAGNWSGIVETRGYENSPATTVTFNVPIRIEFMSHGPCGEGPCAIINVQPLGGSFLAYLTFKSLDMNALGDPLLPSVIPTGITYFATQVTMQAGWLGQGNDYSPTLTSAPAAVPEPATWAMMIGGFGFIGAAMRSRRNGRLAAATFFGTKPVRAVAMSAVHHSVPRSLEVGRAESGHKLA